MIGLAPDTRQGNGPRRVLLPDGGEFFADLADRRIPIDALEGTVRAASQRMLGALLMVRVTRDTEALVADVALGDRVRLVGPDLLDLPSLHIDLDPAVVAAQDADGGEALRIERKRRLRDGGVDLGNVVHGVSWAPRSELQNETIYDLLSQP